MPPMGGLALMAIKMAYCRGRGELPGTLDVLSRSVVNREPWWINSAEYYRIIDRISAGMAP